MVEKPHSQLDTEREVKADNLVISDIEKYLYNRTLVQSVLTIEDLKRRVETGSPVNMMMGQTFDEGQPVDIMKYAFFIMNLSDILDEGGIQVSAKWLIADHFITDINLEEKVTKVQEQVKNRVYYLQQINRIYQGNIGFVFSSELSQHDEYKHNLAILMKEADANKDFREKVLEAIPEDRRSNPNAFRYPFEELATIQTMNTDIKIGPPYERFYDEPARKIAPMVGFNRYIAIHLSKGFPFGNPKITLDTTTLKEIELFGILPYKIGSKGLGNYRLDPVFDGVEKVTELVKTTRDVRAIIDLLVITQQAQQRLRGRTYSTFTLDRLREYDLERLLENKNIGLTQIQFETLREFVLELYIEYIHKPLHSERSLNQYES